jgi:hypothetical protein
MSGKVRKKKRGEAAAASRFWQGFCTRGLTGVGLSLFRLFTATLITTASSNEPTPRFLSTSRAPQILVASFWLLEPDECITSHITIGSQAPILAENSKSAGSSLCQDFGVVAKFIAELPFSRAVY